MKPYPFSAIVGHDRLRLALLLCAVRPEIGGALIRGEKGTAKSTAVRGLAALLSVATGSTETGLVELPLGATEDRVVGSLDLQRVMRDGEHAFSPGLLARAHGGVLYVDEVNLLHDHLVDILLDAAAMGRVHVERDGISHSHEARFVLIGTMNPEEGELRPQLLDRFGLTVDVQASRDIDVRVQVIRRRMAYEADPDAFVARYADADAELAHRIAAARATVDDVVLGDNELRRIAALCAAFDVDGMRADLVVARTAAAHAAWRGVRTVEEQDIRAAAELALPHRRRRDPFDDHGIDRDQLDEALALASVDPEPEPDPPGGGQSANEPASQPNSRSKSTEPGAPSSMGDDPPRPASPRLRSSPRPSAPPSKIFRTRALRVPGSARARRGDGLGPATPRAVWWRPPRSATPTHMDCTCSLPCWPPASVRSSRAVAPVAGRCAPGHPRGSRRQSGDLRRRRFRIDGCSGPDGCGQWRHPVAAARRLPAQGQGGGDHLPPARGNAVAVADVVGAHRRPATGPIQHRRQDPAG